MEDYLADESIGSSTRIEGARLSDVEVDRLLAGVDITSLGNRDEQEVLGYADTMELVFGAWSAPRRMETLVAWTSDALEDRVRRIERERILAALHPLDAQLLELAHQHGRLTLAAAQKITGANRNTLKARFKGLLASGRLRLLGRGRGSWYERA